MRHPRNAFGTYPSAGRYQRPGKAGFAISLESFMRSAMDN